MDDLQAKKSDAWDRIVEVLEEGVDDLKGRPMDDLDLEIVLVRPKQRHHQGCCPQLYTTGLSVTDRKTRERKEAEQKETQSLVYIKELNERLSTLEEMFSDASLTGKKRYFTLN
jgi:hypothetical protein